MWTPDDRLQVGPYGAGQALSDEQFALLAPYIPSAKPGGRRRTTDVRQVLESYAGNWVTARSGGVL